MPRFSLRFSERRLLLLAGDGLVSASAIQVAFWLWGARSAEKFAFLYSSERFYWLLALVVLWGFACLMAGLYHFRTAADKGQVARRLLWLAAIHFGAYLLVFFFSPAGSLPRFFFVVYLALLIPLMLAWRLLYARVITLPNFQRRAVIVGAGWAGRTIAQAIRAHGGSAYHLLGFVDDNLERQSGPTEDLPVLGGGSDLVGIVERANADEIVLAITGPMKGELFQALADCRERGIIVEKMEVLYEWLLHRVPVEHMGREWAIITSDGLSVHRSHRIVKRVFDLALGLVGAVGLGLILPVVALAIYLDSPGPIFYRQARIGQGGRRFSALKFRTMFPDTDERYGVQRTVELDERVTRVGRLLRRTRLNELPQVINVLRGEMSFVGPRPELPEFVAAVQGKIPFYRTRLLVKPGITGWAQVNYGHGALVDDAFIKLQYDLYYIKHWSLFLDLYIVVKTIGVVLGTKGV